MDAVPESSSAGVGNVELVSRVVVPEESVIDREFQLTQKTVTGTWDNGNIDEVSVPFGVVVSPKDDLAGSSIYVIEIKAVGVNVDQSLRIHRVDNRRVSLARLIVFGLLVLERYTHDAILNATSSRGEAHFQSGHRNACKLDVVGEVVSLDSRSIIIGLVELDTRIC